MAKIFDRNWPEVRSDAQLQKLILENPFVDPAYINAATSFLLVKQKALLEKLWVKFEPYADKKFLEKLKRKGEFMGRAWEMVAAVSLLEQGQTLVKRGLEMGPDIKIKSLSTIWVEAVSCTPGTGNDAVPDLVDGDVMDLPIEEMILRVGNAITSKLKKYEGYLADGVVKNNEPFVIAVSKGSIGHVDAHPPLILRYLYGIGDQALKIPIDVKTGERAGKTESFFTRQEPVKKRGGEAVPVAFFEDSSHAGISAVIYCHNHIFNHPEPLGTDFVLLRNPNAHAPLPDEFLSLGAEWVPNHEGLTYQQKNFIAQRDAFDYLY